MRMNLISISLPWPPSTNELTTPIGNRKVTSKRYRIWQRTTDEAFELLGGVRGFAGACSFSLVTHPGTRRAYDLDNRLKSTIDAFVRAGVIVDDDQIEKIRAEKGSLATKEERALIDPRGWCLAGLGDLG